jgi:hypothetical protein
MNSLFFILSALILLLGESAPALAADAARAVVDASSLRGKILCGYQGWFRCPGDAAGGGWVHWSRDGRRVAPETLSFELWPDMTDYTAAERFPAPGFTHPDGSQAFLFSSDNAATVLRHFQWMRDYDFDGAFLQHFAVELPGAPGEKRYASRRRVMQHVNDAATQTGRVWALTYDFSGLAADRVFDVVTNEWKKLVDEKVIASPRYLRHEGRPVVQLWGFYANSGHNAMTPEVGNRLLDFFATPGPYNAFVYGGGDWNWRKNPDAAWQQLYRRFGAYSPWNVGNTGRNAAGEKSAATGYWAADKTDADSRGQLWIPVVYPGFSWDNLQRKPAGSTLIDRRGGRFLWEQFAAVSKLGADTIFLAMFDEVDEGTALFKVTSSPPTQAHFVGYDGLPADWYLRLVREAAPSIRAHQPIPPVIPIKP